MFPNKKRNPLNLLLKQSNLLPRKASYRDKREFQKLQEEIDQLESQKEKLIQNINDGTEDHEQLLDWSNSIQQIDTKLEELEFRWLELSELEGIMDL